MGRKNCEQLVKEAGILVTKDYIREKKQKIEEAAIANFMKSTRYQAEVQKARRSRRSTMLPGCSSRRFARWPQR